jgi:hypothetical protein
LPQREAGFDLGNKITILEPNKCRYEKFRQLSETKRRIYNITPKADVKKVGKCTPDVTTLTLLPNFGH